MRTLRCLTVSQACALLGIQPSTDAAPGLPCSASSRAVQDAEVEVMNLQANDAALLSGVLAHRDAPVHVALVRPRRADAAQAGAGHLPAPAAAVGARRGPVRCGADALAAARHRCSTAAPSAGASSTRCRTTRARTWPSTSSGCRRACSRSIAPRARGTCAAPSARRPRCARRSRSRRPRSSSSSSSSSRWRRRSCRRICGPRPSSRPCAPARRRVGRRRRRRRRHCATRRPRWPSFVATSSRVLSRASGPRAVATCRWCACRSLAAPSASLGAGTPCAARAVPSRASRPRRDSATRSAACAATLRCSRASTRRARCARRCPNRLRLRAATAASWSPRTARG